MKATLTIKGIEYSLDYSCPKCKKMRAAWMFLGKDGTVYKTCEKCRKKGKRS